MGIFLLWVHEYIDIFVNIDGYLTLGCFKRTGGM